MRFRLLGDTGVRVSTYALGSAMFGTWGNTDERECTQIVHRALDEGINLIDTSDIYSDGQAGLPLLDMALAFTKAHPAVTSCLVGPRTPDQLDTILAHADVVLDEATLDAIDAAVPPGTVINPADLGWDPPWMTSTARRGK
jgi:aryl-alcohol dehydrogenase-like predicted oxidoreductase